MARIGRARLGEDGTGVTWQGMAGPSEAWPGGGGAGPGVARLGGAVRGEEPSFIAR